MNAGPFPELARHFHPTVVPTGSRTLRIGILNLMPRLETYEPGLLAALSAPGLPFTPIGIRLETHAYRSSDPAHLAAHYRALNRALATGPLDGLLLTGAPVEELPFEAVRYWAELQEVLDYARDHVGSTLGVCWGGMALAAREGGVKTGLPQKLFGAFRHLVSPAGAAFLGVAPGSTFICPQSRHATITAESIASTDGRLQVLGHSEVVGPTLLSTPDQRFIMHLGHPEYAPSRIAFEWTRDRGLGRTDVPHPAGYDAEGTTPVVSWANDSERLFGAWLRVVAERGSAAVANP
ncbi:MAG: homoserine O-succinyltransferase [Myxococcales bacterium]|nr:homoserine O-succinyltransferase [Myxococcales bacterium]